MPQLNKRKLANTILYLLRGCSAKPGVTQLLKMLYYADSWHYRKYLRPITGGRYVALERGPVLDNYQSLFEGFQDAEILTSTPVPVEGQPKPKIEYSGLKEPDEGLFSESEVEILEEVIRKCGSSTGAALSRRTHEDGPWSYAWDPHRRGRPIPYMLVRWLDNLPDEDERAHAREIIFKRGLDKDVNSLNGGAAASV